jgi:hypothetical protein
MRAHQGRRNPSDKLAEGGGFGAGWHAKGLGFRRRRRSEGSGACRARGGLVQRWTPNLTSGPRQSAGGEVWSAYPFGKEPRVGRGLDVGLGWNAAPQPF